MSDPLMNDFKKEVQKQLTERMEKTFALTLDGISSLPSGEIAFGMIAIPSQLPGYVLTMDVTGKRTETDTYLANLTQKLVAAGVTKTTETYREQQITILKFPPPPAPPAPRGTRTEIVLKPIERFAYYMFLQDVLIASDQPHLLKLIADRLAGQSTAKSLADTEAYQVVMKRCISDMSAGTSPILRWYIEPLDYGESIRTVLQNRSPAIKSRTSIFSILKEQGFDAIRGIGGVVSVKVEEQESVYRTFVYAKKPYRLAMQMLDFPNTTQFTPPVWMPKDLARCTMMYVEPLTIFDNVGVLFDAILMPGQDGEGTWKDILNGLENDKHGPQINLRNELVAHLGNRVMGMSCYEKPITVQSETMVVAVELNPGQEKAMLAGVQKLFGTDKEMQAEEYKSHKIWYRVPLEAAMVPIDDFPDIFGGNIDNGEGVVQVVGTGKKPPVVEDRPLAFPEGGVVVAKGCLFVSTNKKYLKEVLDRLDAPAESSIASESEYKNVEGILSKMGLKDKPHFFQFFARAHETLRPTYEMVRLDQMAQSQALLAKVLNELLSEEGGSGVRHQIIDGSSLPEFDKVQHYFGTIGIYGASEENGYFIKGFAVERK
jgi:hypothetical protein